MDETGEKYKPLNEIPVFGGLIKNFDKIVGDKGLQGAMAELVERTGSKLEVRGKEKVEEVLAKKPVLVVANHPYDAEMIPLIASLPPREDIHIIGGSDFVGIGPNLKKHLIPVYVAGHIQTERQKLSTRMIGRFQFGPRPSPEKARSLNREAINNASQKIREGGMVILFPAGLRGKQAKWFSGIGHLLGKLGEDSNAHIVNAYVKGTSNLDPLRLAPGIRRFLPSLKVTFANSQNIGNLIKKENSPGKLTRLLQDDYNQWVQLLS